MAMGFKPHIQNTVFSQNIKLTLYYLHAILKKAIRFEEILVKVCKPVFIGEF